MQLDDYATDTERQRLTPFVTRLACADTPEIERERARYIDARISSGQLSAAISNSRRSMRAEFDAEAAAGESSVRLQFTKMLDNALVGPCGGPNLDGVIAASALSLLRLYGCKSLTVVDQGNQYKYVPVADDEDALRNLQISGRPVARPVKSRRLH
jgi:hypothetical protein